jgi:uncharacterized protein YrrD
MKRQIVAYPKSKGMYADMKRVNGNTVDISVSKTPFRKDALKVRVVVK